MQPGEAMAVHLLVLPLDEVGRFATGEAGGGGHR